MNATLTTPAANNGQAKSLFRIQRPLTLAEALQEAIIDSQRTTKNAARIYGYHIRARLSFLSKVLGRAYRYQLVHSNAAREAMSTLFPARVVLGEKVGAQ